MDADAELAESLYDKMKLSGVDVWWDSKCLPSGQRWEDGFADGLASAEIFVPILSKAALAPFAQLEASSKYPGAFTSVSLAHTANG